ncbi:MAG: hypothetical protein ACRETL_17355, partial [Gammaproteobacteria bacterium]
VVLAGAIIFEHFLSQWIINWKPNGQAGRLVMLGFRAGIVASAFAAFARLARVPEAVEGFDFVHWQIRMIVQRASAMRYPAGSSERSFIPEEPKQTP